MLAGRTSEMPTQGCSSVGVVNRTVEQAMQLPPNSCHVHNAILLPYTTQELFSPFFNRREETQYCTAFLHMRTCAFCKFAQVTNLADTTLPHTPEIPHHHTTTVTRDTTPSHTPEVPQSPETPHHHTHHRPHILHILHTATGTTSTTPATYSTDTTPSHTHRRHHRPHIHGNGQQSA